MTKLGIVGCGYWGAKHVRSLHELGEYELAVCDRDPTSLMKIQRRYPPVATTQQYEDLLSSDVVGIIVATPVSTHYELARQAILRGKHVLVEKPLTTSVIQAERLVELAERHGVVLMVGHTFVYNPAVLAVRDLIGKGELGSVFYLDSARLNLGLVQRDTDVLWDLAPHDLSIFLHLLETDPVSISARAAAHLDPDTLDDARIDLIFPDGVSAHTHVSWLEPRKERRITIVGGRKMVVYDDVSPTEKVWLFDRSVTRHHQTDEFRDFHVSYRYGNTTILHVAPDEPLQAEQKHFVDCIHELRRPTSDGFAGLKVVSLLEAAHRSLRNGGEWVSLGVLLARPGDRLGTGLDQIVEAREVRVGRSNGVIHSVLGESLEEVS